MQEPVDVRFSDDESLAAALSRRSRPALAFRPSPISWTVGTAPCG